MPDPRRGFRDPDPQVRDRNRWDAAGGQVALGGLARIGSGGRGGGTNVVVRGGRGDAGQVRIEHITLYAEASQTIASGGAGVSWDRIGTAPTELRGFETCADTIGSTGAVVAIPIDVTGVLNATIIGLFSSYRGGGTVTVTITRKGVARAAELDDAGVTSRRFVVILDNLEVRAGDTLTITVPNDSAAGATYSSASVGYSASSTGYSSGAVIVASATAQLKVIELAEISSRATTYRAVVLADGPVGYWRLEETSGSTAADETGNGHDGTHDGTVTLGVGGLIHEGGNGASYPGTNDWTDVGDVAAMEFDGTDPFTLEAWVQRDNVSVDDRAILSKLAAGDVDPAKWELSTVGDGANLSFYVARNDGTAEDAAQSGFSYAAGTTYHVVGTYDGATLRIYVNGALVASTASSRSLADTTGTVRIAARQGPGISGDLDEVAVYDRALTAAEIGEHYRVGTYGGA